MSPKKQKKTHSNTSKSNIIIIYKLVPQISSFLILTSQQYKGAKTNLPCYHFYCVNKHCITTTTLHPAQKYLRTTKWSLDFFRKVSVHWNVVAFIQVVLCLGYI